MSRARILRAEVWTDSRFATLSPYARLLYLGCLNVAICDRGHLNGDAQQLRWQILPGDNVDGATLVDELVSAGLIARVPIHGREFLHLVTFEDEQTASKDGRWKTRCPVCNLSQTQESFEEPPRVSETTENFPVGVGEEPGMGSGGGETASAPPRFCVKHPEGTDAPCGPCRTARLAREEWDEARPGTRDDRGLRPSVPSPGRYLEQGYCKHWNPPRDCNKCAEEGALSA